MEEPTFRIRRDEFVLDPRQRKIRDLLKLIGPEPTHFFTDACRIVDGAAGVTMQTNLAAHSLREIEGRLHDVLNPMLSHEAKAKIKEAGKTKESHRAKINAGAEILSLDKRAHESWLEYALQLHKLAHRAGLAGPRDVAEFRDHFAKGQSVLLAILSQLKTIYFEARPIMLELAGVRNPTQGHMKRLRNKVPHSTVMLGEFFSAARVEWFPLLRDKGYFENPPLLEVDDEGRVAYAEWPAARFLVRAAAVEELQDVVVEILNALDTDNPAARDATVEAALAMTPARAARLATKIAGYVRASETWWTPRQSEELVTHLLGGGEVAAALEITKPLLGATPRTADWRMKHAFIDLVPRLFPAVGLDGVALLADLLAEELTAMGREASNYYSTIWRESVKGGPGHNRRDLLVTGLNNAAESLVASGVPLRDVAGTLLRDDRAIFRRIVLHLIANHPQPDIAAEWLGNEDAFRAFTMEREYTELARAAFAQLDAVVKERMFGWIQHGPNWRPLDVPENEWEEYDERWRLGQLRRLPELSEAWQQRYDELVTRFGEPADPLAPRIGRVFWSGTRSPKSKDELLALTDDDLIVFLETWKQDGDWFGPSIEGLANELRDAAGDAPRRFSRLLPRLADSEPTYARNVVCGLRHAARDGGGLDWRPLLEFARRIVDLPAQLEGRDPAGGDIDPGWEWSRLEVARVITAGLAQRAIPPEFADDVWSVIAALAEDDDPTVETENEREREGTEPEILSLNSVRPCAVEAAIRFAAWSASEAREGAGGSLGVPQNVREVLDRHLDPERERTRAVQAVFGRHFNQLYSLDPEWTTEHVSAVFPDDPEQAGRRDAAWRAFIDANLFWPTSWQVLEPQYRRAVEALANERFDEEEVSLLDATGRLLEHLLSAYLNDLIELSDESLLGVFFEKAPLRLRRTFFELIGTDLSDGHDVSELVQTKLQQLWGWRSEKVLTAGNASELAGFGWWFGSGKMPHEWSVEELMRVLETGGGVTFDYVVTQRLPDLAATDLLAGVRIVAALVEHAYTPDMVLSAQDQFRAVLAPALASGDERLMAIARETISRLYAERHTEFNDLLE